MKNLILAIQNKFLEELEEKDSWEKNEIQALFQGITVEVLSEYASALAHLRNTPIREPSEPLPDQNDPVPAETQYNPTAAFGGFDEDDLPF